MKPNPLAALTGLALMAGCADVSSTSRDTLLVDGRSYDLRTRVIGSGGRSFEHTDVRVNGIAVPCLPDSPGDCAAAVRRELSRYDRAGTD